MRTITIRTLALLIAVASLCDAAADDYAPLQGDRHDHLPPDTAGTSWRFPRFIRNVVYDPAHPLDERRDLANSWTDAMRANADAIPGTRLAAEMLFSAAAPYQFAVPDAVRYRRNLEEARDAVRADDPLHAVITLRLGRLDLTGGNQPRAEAAILALEGWRNPIVPADLDPGEQSGWNRFRALWVDEFPVFEADVLRGVGRFGEAAAVLEARAEDDGEMRHDRASRYADAAKMYARAGDGESAARTIGEALNHTDDPVRTGRWVVWQLYARHGLLRPPDLIPGPSKRWPGAAFESDAVALLDRLDGMDNAAAMVTYSVVGSHAHYAGEDAFSVDVYLRAMDNPFFLDAARRDPSLIENGTIGVAAAIQLGRLDEAERLLELLIRLADREPPMTKELRAMLAEKRVEDADARRGRESAGEAPEGPTGPADTTGRVVGIQPEREARGSSEPADVSATPPMPASPLVLGALLAVGAATLWWRRRRDPA